MFLITKCCILTVSDSRSCPKFYKITYYYKSAKCTQFFSLMLALFIVQNSNNVYSNRLSESITCSRFLS